VTYATLAAGAEPYVKILGASQEPTVTTEDGVLTISSGKCDAGDPAVTDAPFASPTAAPPTVDTPTTETSSASSRSLTTALGLSAVTMFSSGRYTATAATALTLLASAQLAHGAGHLPAECNPSLSIEVGVPAGASTTEKFGETDHYLAATVDTVVWGYFDPNATADTSPVTMSSGETITVEVITHHSGHDYAKMIRGDPAIEEIFYWEANQTTFNKPEPKLPGSGVHLITGPINIDGAMPGDIVQVDILELDPRPNADGKTYGTNSQKFAGYQYRLGEKRDGTPYTRAGGTEAITVFEFVEDESGNMLYGKPVYMYRFPNMTTPVGDTVTFDGNPAVVVPHEFNMGYDGMKMEEEAIVYPAGFDDIAVIDEGGIIYMNPDPAALDFKVPLRPHLGTLGVMPSNTINYVDDAAPGGANSIPPSRFGGNVDDWRIGKGGTMYYKCEVEGCLVIVGDTHAAQGDSELAGTAMETSLTTKLRIILHKEDSLPKLVTGVDWPLLETSTEYVVHGFAYANYLDELEDASTIFAEGATIDAAMADAYVKTRNWLMDAWDLIEEETIALMTTSVDFGVTQVVDGNWGCHASIPKFVFDKSEAGYDYSCTTSKTAGRRNLKSKPQRRLKEEERRDLFAKYAGNSASYEEHHNRFFNQVTESCETCGDSSLRNLLADKLLDAKLHAYEQATAN